MCLISYIFIASTFISFTQRCSTIYDDKSQMTCYHLYSLLIQALLIRILVCVQVPSSDADQDISWIGILTISYYSFQIFKLIAYLILSHQLTYHFTYLREVCRIAVQNKPRVDYYFQISRRRKPSVYTRTINHRKWIVRRRIISAYQGRM